MYTGRSADVQRANDRSKSGCIVTRPHTTLAGFTVLTREYY